MNEKDPVLLRDLKKLTMVLYSIGNVKSIQC